MGPPEASDVGPPAWRAGGCFDYWVGSLQVAHPDTRNRRSSSAPSSGATLWLQLLCDIRSHRSQRSSGRKRRRYSPLNCSRRSL